jgi:hypothetical protein
MPHWIIKSVTQRAISVLPASWYWNELFQKHITHSLDLTPPQFENRIAFCRKHLEHLLSVSPEAGKGFNVLEIGTGWHPIIPIGLYLCGASDIYTFDVQPLLRPAHLRPLLEYFSHYLYSGKLQALLPQIRSDRVDAIRESLELFSGNSVRPALERLHIHYLIQDARNTGLPSGSIDFVVSNAVLEYIPRAVLPEILTEVRRVAAPHAVMSQRVNLSDQFAYFDKNITPFNFLRYSENEWAWLSSPLIRENRLRISDYRRLFKEAGFEVISEENTLGNTSELASVPLAPEFEPYAREDLLVLESFLLARKMAPRLVDLKPAAGREVACGS